MKNKPNIAIIISNHNSLIIRVLKSLKMQTQNSIEEKIEDKPIISMENNIKAKTKQAQSLIGKNLFACVMSFVHSNTARIILKG